MDGVIYKITNLVNNKIYIGKTVNLAQRWASHRRIAKQWEYDEQTHHKHKYRSFLYAAMSKYGNQNFIIEIIDHATTKEQLNVLEKYWINYLHTQDPAIGYNITEGGTGGTTNLGKKFSAETCQKISEGKRGKNVGKITINNGQSNKFIWPEQLEEFRKQGYVVGALKKPPLSEEAKRKHRISMENRSPEAKELTHKKLPSSLSGNKNPMYGKIPWNKGKASPLAVNQKISNTRKLRNIPSSIKGRIAIHKENQTKYIDKTQLQLYLNQGYLIGGAPRQKSIIKGE